MIIFSKSNKKYVSDAIFYDTTKQAHFKLLKKLENESSDSSEWEAEKCG